MAAMEWNEVTWYSRIIAILLFVGILPVLNFYIGVKYQETIFALEESVNAQLPIPVCPLPESEQADTSPPLQTTAP